MNIIAWILIGIVGLNLIVFGMMWAVFLNEGRRERGKRKDNQYGRTD